MKTLLKVLVGVVCYAGIFFLAYLAVFSDRFGLLGANGIGGDRGFGGVSPFSWIVIAVLEVFGWIAMGKSNSYLVSPSYPGLGMFLQLMGRLIFGVLIGMFVAPWKIAGKIVSWIP